MKSARVAAVVMLGMELSPLRELVGWEPVGVVLEDIPNMLRGAGTASKAQTDACRRWAGRWRELDPALRAFYAAETGRPGFGSGEYDGLVESALWRILEGDARPALSDRQTGALIARYRGLFGVSPHFELAPSKKEHRRR